MEKVRCVSTKQDGKIFKVFIELDTDAIVQTQEDPLDRFQLIDDVMRYVFSSYISDQRWLRFTVDCDGYNDLKDQLWEYNSSSKFLSSFRRDYKVVSVRGV